MEQASIYEEQEAWEAVAALCPFRMALEIPKVSACEAVDGASLIAFTWLSMG